MIYDEWRNDKASYSDDERQEQGDRLENVPAQVTDMKALGMQKTHGCMVNRVLATTKYMIPVVPSKSTQMAIVTAAVATIPARTVK